MCDFHVRSDIRVVSGYRARVCERVCTRPKWIITPKSCIHSDARMCAPKWGSGIYVVRICPACLSLWHVCCIFVCGIIHLLGGLSLFLSRMCAPLCMLFVSVLSDSFIVYMRRLWYGIFCFGAYTRALAYTYTHTYAISDSKWTHKWSVRARLNVVVRVRVSDARILSTFNARWVLRNYGSSCVWLHTRTGFK